MEKAMTLPLERGEEDRGVSSAALVRGSGLLAVISGASILAAPVLHPHSPQDAAWVPVHVAYFATLIAVMLVLVGVFARQFEEAGKLGVAGFLAAFFGTAMMLMAPPIGVPAVLIVSHTVFGVGLAWVGYALWSGEQTRKGIVK